MSRLRITMLAPFGIRPKGTLSARMLPLAQALTRRGHQVSIVAPPVQNPQDAGRRDSYDGVPVIHTPLSTLPGPAGVAQQVQSLVRHAMAEHPDLIHLFKPKGYSGLAALLLRLARPNLPLVVDTDDWEGWGGWNDLLPYPRSAKTLFAWQERDLPRRADAVTVASRTLQTQVWGFGVPPERVFYIPNGVSDVERWNVGTFQHSNVLTILLYTRFWEFDVRDLVAALVPIVAGCPAARLLVVGRGERGEERELLRLAGRAGLAGAIDYRGWVEPEQIPALLAGADLALAPMNDTLINRARSLAKLLELMAAGLPIVAGRVGQVAEYIEDGRSGLLVAPRDPADLARATLALLADAPLRERLGQGARERVARHYAWNLLAGEVERAYQLARRPSYASQ
ncbi:MAG TPA: glycosyltransferase family 4 protein [Roseiflexaceae bacterium]|nr:glycosyltransferase family 4 protein [Roseiflexaceae bacterium]